MPSSSTGFWVATTKNASESGWRSPSSVTWRSSIASSSAAWVLGGVRLISSASRKSVNTGPRERWNVPVRGSSTWVPTTSAGIRSGVNWMRR